MFAVSVMSHPKKMIESLKIEISLKLCKFFTTINRRYPVATKFLKNLASLELREILKREVFNDANERLE